MAGIKSSPVRMRVGPVITGKRIHVCECSAGNTQTGDHERRYHPTPHQG